MTMAYIRGAYHVPARRGARIEFRGEPGTVISARGQYLRVRLDAGEVVLIHPTWRVNWTPDQPIRPAASAPRRIVSDDATA